LYVIITKLSLSFINKKYYKKILEKIKIETSPEMVQNVYSKLEKNISIYRKTTNRSLTLAEKILAGHLEESFLEKVLDNESNYVFLHPDRVALQDVTGQKICYITYNHSL
jgi:aconitate hydratase